jgi:hypothetical protein
MNTPDNDKLRAIVNSHLDLKASEASKPNFEKAKAEIIFAKTALTKSIAPLTMEKYLEITEQSSAGFASDQKVAVDYLDSYFIPLPSESINAAFTRAKRESIAKLKSEAAQLKYFSFKDYGFKKKKKTSASRIRKTNFDNVRVEKRRST